MFHAIEATEKYVPLCIDELGDHPWLFSTDYPHPASLPWPVDVTDFYERTDIASDVKYKILGENALRPLPSFELALSGVGATGTRRIRTGSEERKLMAQATATRRPIQDAYTRWIESVGVPIYRGHIVSDMRSAELGWWEERQCNAAFLQLEGMEGLSESRVTEIPPGKTLPPLKFALGEVVYVLEGQGLCTVWSGNGPKKTFEWQKHSMFQLPRYCYHQLTNIRGDQPARLFHYNYLAFAMTVMPDPAFFFNGDYEDESLLYGQEDAFSQAKAVLGRGASDARAEAWAPRPMTPLPPHATEASSGLGTSSRT